MFTGTSITSDHQKSYARTSIVAEQNGVLGEKRSCYVIGRFGSWTGSKPSTGALGMAAACSLAGLQAVAAPAPGTMSARRRPERPNVPAGRVHLARRINTIVTACRANCNYNFHRLVLPTMGN